MDYPAAQSGKWRVLANDHRGSHTSARYNRQTGHASRFREYSRALLLATPLANAGTYEVSGDLITIHSLVAKIPVVMKPSANEIYRFQIEGKTLTPWQVRNARGRAVDSVPTFKFVRAE